MKLEITAAETCCSCSSFTAWKDWIFCIKIIGLLQVKTCSPASTSPHFNVFDIELNLNKIQRCLLISAWWQGFVLFHFLLLNEADGTDSSPQHKSPDGRFAHCSSVGFCLSACLSPSLPPFYSSLFCSAPNHMFPQTILSGRIECHKIIWFKIMRPQVLFFFFFPSLFLMGLLAFSLLALQSEWGELSWVLARPQISSEAGDEI